MPPTGMQGKIARNLAFQARFNTFIFRAKLWRKRRGEQVRVRGLLNATTLIRRRIKELFAEAQVFSRDLKRYVDPVYNAMRSPHDRTRARARRRRRRRDRRRRRLGRVDDARMLQIATRFLQRMGDRWNHWGMWTGPS